MKKLFSSAFSAIKKSAMLVALFSMSIVANAATYALYGNVPEGATDLTANVSAQALGSATFADGVFTGAGLPGRICESSSYLQMNFLAEQAMNLSENFAIHIVVAKAAGVAGDLQLALCNNGWNAARLGYIIPNASINETATDIVLTYADRVTTDWNSYGETSFIGTPATFGAAEFLRVCAAAAEAFTISSIYVTDEAAVTPEPEPEPTPEPANGAYYLYGTAPEGTIDLTSKVTIEAVGSATFADGVFTGAGLPGRICESSNYLKMSFTEAQALTLTEAFEVHVVLAKAEAAVGNVQVAFCNNGWNNGRLGYTIANENINTTDTDIALAYADRVATDWNSYGEASFIGAPANFPAAEIFRLCAAAGEQFTIKAIYVTAETTNQEPEQPAVIPDQDPQRIYLRKGTAVTPAGVAETADYTATTSVSSVHWNCIPSETFFGITTMVKEWWLNFQLKSSADVDLTPVYNTWNLVFRVKNGVVNEGQDRGLTVQVNGQNMSTMTTYADATNFVTYVLPLKDVIFGTNNLGNIATGGTIIDFSSTFDNNAGQTIEFDYIYLTNETERIPASVSVSANAIAWNKVELSLYAECTTSTKVTYDVTYNGTTKTFIGNAGATTTCVIDGLEGSTAYTFSVVAKNSAGEAAPVTANATTPAEPEVIGYAIFGEVPAGYMDLTSHVSVNGYGTYSDKVSVEEGKIKFTGNTSLSNSRVCADEANIIRLQFTSAQALTLTSNLAIYIKVKKGSANSESNLHFALCKDSWNNNRIGDFIPQAKISNTAEKEIILKYADYSTSDWSSAGSVIGNNVTFGAGDIVRLQAQTDDYFEITQIYIEKTYTPEPAPTNVTATATATEWDKVTLNLQANCEKSTVVTYEVTYGSTTKTFTGNAGELTTCVIEGLEGSTEYTFSVVAKNEDGVAADAVTTNLVTTPAKPEGMEIRYYFYRGNNIDPLPNSETLKSVDARPSAYAKLGGENMNVNTEISDYTRFDILNNYSKQVHTLTTTIPNSINDSYYLVVRFKTDMSTPENGNLSLNLSDALGQFPINNTETITYNDEKWHIVKFQLKDCKGTTPLPSAYLQENGVGLQVFMSKGAKNGEYFDIDYAYLTNDATKVDEGTVADIPTGPVSPQDAPGTRYYIVGEGTDATLHKSVDCTITYGNLAHQDTRVSDYYSMKTGNHDWTEITFKSNTTVANTIDAYDSSNWHLVMRFRSSIDNYILGFNNFQVNLKNQEGNFTINSPEYVTYGDGQWHTVKFKLSEAAKKTPVQYLQAGQIAAQVYVRSNSNHLQKDEFFDIDYLYFTNDPAEEDPNPRTDRKILLHDNRINNDNYITLLEKNNGNTVDVDLNRSFVADGAWYTLCLPFSMTADQVNAAFGACKLAKLNGSELRGSSLIHLNFDYVNTIEAGVPYLFMPMANVQPVIIEDVVIDNTLRPIETTYFNMKGIFYPTHVATGDYFLGTDNYLIAVKDGDSTNLKGLRAYFTIGAGAPASARARVVMAPTVATDLQENTVTTTAEKVIIDGTIYILRGDKIYTTTGQLVK